MRLGMLGVYASLRLTYHGVSLVRASITFFMFVGQE